MFNKALHRYAVFTAINTFILIFIGGLVTSTGSGLSVPDWPNTYGQNMFFYPLNKWIGGIQYEHGHRLFASYVGFLVVVLAVWLAVQEKRKWVKIAGFVAVAMVIIQGILGGLTVLYLLPTAISVAHGMLAQIFFCVTACIALFTSTWWKTETVVIEKNKEEKLRAFMILSSIVVFIQLVLGACMRHTYSGLAVPDFPLAFGQIFPSLSREALAHYNQRLVGEGIRWQIDTPIAAYQIFLHMLHRYWGYVVVGIVAISGYRLYISKFLPQTIRRNGIMMVAVVLIQFVLGILTVITHKKVVITTAHVAIGAYTLILCVVTTLQLVRISSFYFSRISYSE